jgi:hypothetical protein
VTGEKELFAHLIFALGKNGKDKTIFMFLLYGVVVRTAKGTHTTVF